MRLVQHRVDGPPERRTRVSTLHGERERPPRLRTVPVQHATHPTRKGAVPSPTILNAALSYSCVRSSSSLRTCLSCTSTLYGRSGRAG